MEWVRDGFNQNRVLSDRCGQGKCDKDQGGVCKEVIAAIGHGIKTRQEWKWGPEEMVGNDMFWVNWRTVRVVFASRWIWGIRENKQCRSEVRGKQCKLETYLGGNSIEGDGKIQDWMIKKHRRQG